MTTTKRKSEPTPDLERVRAKPYPYSSIVGNGVMLFDGQGRVFAQLRLSPDLAARFDHTPEQHREWAEQVARMVARRINSGVEAVGEGDPS